MKKKLSVSILLLTIMTAAWMVTGCGDKGQDDVVSQTEEISGTEQSSNEENDEEQENDKEDGQDETEKGQAEDMRDQSDGESSDKPTDAAENQPTDNDASADGNTNKPINAPTSDAPDTSPNESAELSVDVESVGDNSVVGNKIFIESSANGNKNIAIVRVGEDNKVLVTVYFAEDASYVYRTIRNGGADVETREGSFSDIKNGLSLDLTGHYEGDDFYANKVEINNVILD